VNYNQLADELAKLYADIKEKRIDLTVAHELNNTAANITSVVRLGLLNSKLQGKTPDLAFFAQARTQATRKEK
jgi:hypothetical protein